MWRPGWTAACAGRRASTGSGSGILRANTFIYEFDFRRVKVAESSLQVYPDAVTQSMQPR